MPLLSGKVPLTYSEENTIRRFISILTEPLVNINTTLKEISAKLDRIDLVLNIADTSLPRFEDDPCGPVNLNKE